MTPLGRRFKVQTEEGERELDVYSDEGFAALGELFTRAGWHQRTSYRLSWLGRPVIQLPEDVVMMQELLWDIRPDVVVECGVAHGGNLVLFASVLELIGHGRVVGVDVEVRPHNRAALEAHPLWHRITLIEGSSVEERTIAAVRSEVGAGERVLVALDSKHTKDHVAAELEAYAPLVGPGSYVVVFDGVMTLLGDAPAGDPSWAHDNPLAAADEFLARHPEFERDPSYDRFGGVTHCQGGFLRRR